MFPGARLIEGRQALWRGIACIPYVFMFVQRQAARSASVTRERDFHSAGPLVQARRKGDAVTPITMRSCRPQIRDFTLYFVSLCR